MPKEHEYFSHTACEYYPCHDGAETGNFNCLFCYCPLYALGERCGGDFVYLPGGIKDCSACLYPHKRENYAAISARFQAILAALPPRGEKPENETTISISK